MVWPCFHGRHDVPGRDPSTQVKIPSRGGKLAGTYQVDADLASSAEQSRPRGPVVLPIFIRQGWPQAMNHLPWNHQGPLCGTPFPQVTPDREGQSYWFSFDEGMRSLHAMGGSSLEQGHHPVRDRWLSSLSAMDPWAG
jgi:hypothetical protein